MYKRLITYLLLTAAILGAPVSAEAGKRDTQIANRVAQWQIDNFGRYLSKGDRRSDQHWANGALYRGMVVWAETSGYKPCEEFVLGIGRRNGWCMGRRQYHADDICVGQAYLMLYQRYGDTAMLRPVLQRADSVIAFPAKTKLHIKAKNGSKRWSWCDALFMAPPVYALLTRITGDPKYLQFMNSEFYASQRSTTPPSGSTTATPVSSASGKRTARRSSGAAATAGATQRWQSCSKPSPKPIRRTGTTDGFSSKCPNRSWPARTGKVPEAPTGKPHAKAGKRSAPMCAATDASNTCSRSADRPLRRHAT